MNNNFTKTHISFLPTISRKLQIDKSGKYFYKNLENLSLIKISALIMGIENNDIFLIFPFITSTRRPCDPYLRLSEPFLITNQSNPKLITDFLQSQWDNCDFLISDDTQSWLYIKYKKVYVNEIKF
jgi:hypothetical protein